MKVKVIDRRGGAAVSLHDVSLEVEQEIDSAGRRVWICRRRDTQIGSALTKGEAVEIATAYLRKAR